MYESFYGLTANPFRLVPDARFFYPSSGHKRGLAYLRYGLEQGQGFVVITGKPGTGKSTLIQILFSELSDQSLVVASLNNTSLDEMDALHAVRLSFGIRGECDNKASLLISIENFLKMQASQGKRAVLIVDEAHNLPQKSMEELRMLSNFQMDDRSLIQILLLGQYPLAEMLARPDMEQLKQRVIATCNLQPMSADETRAYIGHRLRCAGWKGDPAISGAALALIHAASEGVPRMINIFCDRLLLSASISEKHEIGLALAETILEELKQESASAFRSAKTGRESLIALGPLPADDFPAETSLFKKVSSVVRQEVDAGPGDDFNPIEIEQRIESPAIANTAVMENSVSVQSGMDDEDVAARAQIQDEEQMSSHMDKTKAIKSPVIEDMEMGLYELHEKSPAKSKKGLLLLLLLVLALLVIVPIIIFAPDLKMFFQGDWLGKLRSSVSP